MIDRSLFNVEDFLVDNTFQLYCAGTDKLCISYWENYIKAHPEQETTITEAKRLYVILSGHKKPLNQQVAHLKQNLQPHPENEAVPLYKNHLWLKVAASIIVVLAISVLYFNNLKKVEQPVKTLITHFSTQAGERKRITLPDGSVILLNAKSSITLSKEFNIDKREVNLIGEAYFDVTHNKNKPFQVHTEDFDINVLGTSFNVKVYPGEATSEAVLIKGLIVMEGKGSKGNSITLKPSQKVTFYKRTLTTVNNKSVKVTAQHPEIAINHYTKVNDSTIVEMAWTQNRLEILDQNFADLKDVLERWYNVEISFTDHDIEKYHFTATFSKENIQEVLNALQKAEHFKYEIKGNQITISR